MKTYFSTCVRYNNSGSATCSHGDTLESALASAVQDAIYHKAHYPANVVTYELAEKCAVCHNMGEVARPKFKRVRCPECKGKCPSRTIGPIELKLPNEHNNIKLIAG